MDRKKFEIFRSVFKKKLAKSSNKKKEIKNRGIESNKKKNLSSIFNSITRPLLNMMSKYSVEQEDIVGLDITPKNIRVAQLNNIKNKWILEKLSYKFVEIPTGLPDEKKAQIYIDQIKEALLSGKIT